MTAKECLVEFKKLIVRKIRKVIKIQNSDVMSVCLEKITNAQLMLLSVDMRIRRANK